MEIGTLFYSACKSLALGYLLKIFLRGINRKPYDSLVWIIALMNVALCVYLIITQCVESVVDWLEPFRNFVENLNNSKVEIDNKITDFGKSLNPKNWWNWLPDWAKVKGE